MVRGTEVGVEIGRGEGVGSPKVNMFEQIQVVITWGMHTAHFSGHHWMPLPGRGVSIPFQRPSLTEITTFHRVAPPFTENRQRPPEGTWDQVARQEVTSYRDPHGQTNRCKNITLPQTSFLGGNKENTENKAKIVGRK